MVGLASIAQAFNPINNNKRAEALMLSLSEKNDKPLGDYLRFQYFPETVSDSKKNNWQSKEIPGASLPVKQWIAGGDRTISFTAFFTCDVDLMVGPSIAGSAASGTQGEPSFTRLSQLKSAGQDDRNIDIRAAIVWLRRHMLPTYDPTGSVGTITYAPRKVRLQLTNSGIGLYGGVSHSTTKDSIVAVMTQCDVVLETFFQSGLPRIAVVTLAFDQVAQYNGFTEFPSIGPLDSLVPNTPSSGAWAANPGTTSPQEAGPQSTQGVVPYTLAKRAKIFF